MITNIPSVSSKKRVIIVGGGFGGLRLATKLSSKRFQIILLDKNNYHQFQPLLYQVATTGLEVSSIAYPFRKNFQKRDIHFRLCEVTKIIPEENQIDTNIGNISYDYLVIASGCDTNFFGNDALMKSTISLKSVPEALFARNRILQSFENATVTQDIFELKKLLTFVIVGGGATGVELAGALADMKAHVLPKDYPELDFSLMKIQLIDASPRLLSAMSENASSEASKTLKERGVIIHQDISVSSYENDIIKTSDGKEIFTKNVLWVAGIKGKILDGLSREHFGRGNRIKVNEYCLLNGHNNIFAIGDVAYMETADYPNGHPQVAQGAIQMANLVALNLERSLNNEPAEKFQYKDKGSLATIGRNAAVADLGKLKFSGLLAWWLWLVVHIFTIIGIRNKILIMLDWAWNYVTYDSSLRLLIRHKSPSD